MSEHQTGQQHLGTLSNFIRFYYPTRKDLPSLIKISEQDMENNNWMEMQAQKHNQKCESMYPQICFRWLTKSCIKKMNFQLICQDSINSGCRAKIRYEYDKLDNCFYMKQCNNQHFHVVAKSRANLIFDRRCKMKKFIKAAFEDDEKEEVKDRDFVMWLRQKVELKNEEGLLAEQGNKIPQVVLDFDHNL